MTESNCNSSCNLAIALLGLLIIILVLRFYYLNRPNNETFTSHPGNNMTNHTNMNNHSNINNHSNMNNSGEPHVYHPCSPENFKKSLHEFYKSAESYRALETELHQAQLEYEKKYETFMKQHQNLSYHKDRISQCVNDTD